MRRVLMSVFYDGADDRGPLQNDLRWYFDLKTAIIVVESSQQRLLQQSRAASMFVYVCVCDVCICICVRIDAHIMHICQAFPSFRASQFFIDDIHKWAAIMALSLSTFNKCIHCSIHFKHAHKMPINENPKSQLMNGIRSSDILTSELILSPEVFEIA